jgi:CRISPR-associated protein Csy2
MRPTDLLILSRVRVQNANLLASPLTWGFPSPTALLGFADALDRFSAKAFDVSIRGAGVICHRFEPQVFEPPGKRHRVLRLTRNPVGKDGKPQALVEEGRVHLTISLIFGLVGDGLYTMDKGALAEELDRQARCQRFAGGSILPDLGDKVRPPLLVANGEDSRKVVRRLLPGFALVSREAVLAQRMRAMRASAPHTSSYDALLDFCRINYECVPDPHDDTKGTWGVRKNPGWFVPIAHGYRALSQVYAPGEVKATRDSETPFRFVESIYTLGQWLSPHRAKELDSLLWFSNYDDKEGLYTCSTPAFSGVELESEDNQKAQLRAELDTLTAV